MSSNSKPPANPFYVALVIIGVVFLITACAYCVMAFREVKSASPEFAASGDKLMQTMHDHGMAIMLVELVLLALATVGAIGLDDYRIKQKARGNAQPESDPPSNRN